MTAIPIIETANGKNVLISHTTFDGLKKMYREGYFSAIIKDLSGNIHSVVINQERLKN